MKLFVSILLALCALAAANNEFPEYENIDWSKIVPVQDMPGFWDGRVLKPASEAELASSRIVGGNQAAAHQFPHQVALLTTFGGGGQGLCGGSIIRPVSVIECRLISIHLTL